MSVLLGGARARTLRVASPAIPVFLGHPALEPVRLSGHEGLNSLMHLPNVKDLHTSFSLGEVKASHSLPLGHLGVK